MSRSNGSKAATLTTRGGQRRTTRLGNKDKSVSGLLPGIAKQEGPGAEQEFYTQQSYLPKW